MWRRDTQNTLCLQRQRLEWYAYRPRNSKDWRPPPSNQKGARRNSTKVSQGAWPCWHIWFQASSLQNNERKQFCCLKPPTLCYLVIIDLRNQDTSQEHGYEIFTESKITSVVRWVLFHGSMRKKKILPVKLCSLVLNDNLMWCINWSHYLLNVVQHLSSTPKDLVISCAFKCFTWREIGNHFAQFPETTYNYSHSYLWVYSIIMYHKARSLLYKKIHDSFILPKLLR